MTNPKKTWKKDHKLDELRSFLKRVKEANFTQILQYLNVSAPTLTRYLKELIAQDEFESFKKENRTYEWYRIKSTSSEVIDSKLGKYQATQFIASLDNPLYLSKPVDKNINYSIFLEKNNPKDRELSKKTLNYTNSRLVTKMIAILSKAYSLKNGEKGVLIVTMKGE